MRLFFLSVTIVLLTSCDFINPSEDQPSYLNIDQYTLTATPLQGGNTHKILDAWVYVDNEFLGAFTLPASVPVLAEGEQVIEIFPGIKVNGINAIPDIYPFYERFSVTRNLQPGEEVSIMPNATYVDNTVFLLVERFNDAAHQMSADLDEDTETRIEIISNAESLDGHSGRIHLDEENNVLDVGSVPLTETPQTSSTFYVELDYQTDIILYVGLIAYDANDVLLFSDFSQGMNPNTSWNKIYLDLSTSMSTLKQLQGMAYYRLVLSTALLPNNPDGLTTATIYIDNLKVLQF